MQSLNPYLAPILETLNLYLDKVPQTDEHHIIKHLQEQQVPPFDHFKLAQANDLFHAHFLCMHALYHLKNRYLQEKRYCLLIQSVRVERHIFLEHASSAHEPPGHTLLDTPDPLAAYYLNPKHYFDTQESDITDMLKSFWKKYLAQDQKHEALQALDLPADADPIMIKKQYRRLAQQHHPDKGGNAELFNKVREAKSILDNALS